MKFVRLLREEKYYLLLATQLAFVFTLPFFPNDSRAAALVDIGGISLIMLAGINVIDKKRLKVFGWVITALFACLTFFVQFGEYPVIYFITFVLFFILFILIDARIIQMLIYSKELKPSLVAGSIAGYLMIGISLAFFIIAFSAITGEVLSEPIRDLGFQGLMYYSFVTMTTIGYGEITPVHPVMQTVSIMSGVFSQFYMAVVVAVIVGKLMNNKP